MGSPKTEGKDFNVTEMIKDFSLVPENRVKFLQDLRQDMIAFNICHNNAPSVSIFYMLRHFCVIGILSILGKIYKNLVIYMSGQ